MDYSSIANLPNIGPGSTDKNSVTQLQNWLVQNGYMTQSDMNTGPGIYGPKTTAAVASWQQKSGIDTQGNPGWFGPISKSYITQQSAPKTQASTTQTSSTPPVGNQYTTSLAAVDTAQHLATLGQPVDSFTKALTAAQNDPNIVAKYADMAKLDSQGFTQSLQAMQAQYGAEANQQKMQFENDRKELAEHNAAAGTAYSGFRGKAEANLAQTESGIVTSTRSQQTQALNNLTSQFESKYGTGSSSLASISLANPLPGGGTDTLSGQLAGGITGTEPIAKQSDVNQQAMYNYNTALLPK